MKIQHLTCALLGAWIAGSLFMIMVATQNFRSVDRLLAEPGRASAQVERMGRDDARTFLRYQVSEQNRWYFETWEKIQLALGLGLLVVAMSTQKIFRFVVALKLVFLLIERL